MLPFQYPFTGVLNVSYSTVCHALTQHVAMYRLVGWQVIELGQTATPSILGFTVSVHGDLAVWMSNHVFIVYLSFVCYWRIPKSRLHPIGQTSSKGKRSHNLCLSTRHGAWCLESFHLTPGCTGNVVTQWLLSEESPVWTLTDGKNSWRRSSYLPSVSFTSSHAEREKGLLEYRPWIRDLHVELTFF